MRRISLSVLAGALLLGATAAVVHGARAGLGQRAAQLAQLLSTRPPFANPAVPRTIQAPPIRPPLPQGMACPVAAGSSGGGCGVVPCAIYVGTAQTSYTVTGAGLSLAPVLPRLTPSPAPGGSTPAGACVSRPGRPPQMRWVSSAGR